MAKNYASDVTSIITLLTNKQGELDTLFHEENGLPNNVTYLTGHNDVLQFTEYEQELIRKFVAKHGKDKHDVKLTKTLHRDGRVVNVPAPVLRLFAPADEPDKIMLIMSERFTVKHEKKLQDNASE